MEENKVAKSMLSDSVVVVFYFVFVYVNFNCFQTIFKQVSLNKYIFLDYCLKKCCFI